MALHKDFLQSPHAIVDPGIRWFPADEALRDTSMEKLMPPLVAELRRKVKEFRDAGYADAADTSRSLLNWWFKTPHLLPKAYLPSPSGRGAGGEGLEAIKQNVVKHPVLPDAPSRTKLSERQSAKYTEKYADYIHLGVIVYVDEESFEKFKPSSFRDLLDGFKEYKGNI